MWSLAFARLACANGAVIGKANEWGQAFVAHDDMLKAYKATDRSAYPGLSTKSPSVTTTMVIGDTAYISSSLTGGGYLYSPVMIKDGDGKAVTRYENIDPKHVCTKRESSSTVTSTSSRSHITIAVVDALSRCELRGVNFGGHRNGANCGEAMAALAYCTTNDAATFADGNTKIVSIKGKSPDKYAVIAPCAGPGGLKYQGDWGCHDFTGEVGLGMRVIDPSTTRQSTDVAANDITITYAEYP